MSSRRKGKSLIAILLSASMLVSACSYSKSEVSEEDGVTQMTVLNASLPRVASSNAAYEIFVGSYCDSDGDGVGDIPGITSKLNYISGMGFDMIWLTPVCTSPSYHKYDVADYYMIDPSFGTIEDFDTLIAECHDRDMKVIIDFVMNHTSTEHQWFVDASEAVQDCHSEADLDAARESCEFVDFYNFSMESSAGYVNLPGTDVYYEAQFWEGMPDLNLDNPSVREELELVAHYWLGMGVDGFRLDATTYYYSGANQSNIEFLTWFNDVADSINPDAYIVCEAWTDPATYIPYYESGVDGIFNFSFSGQNGTIARVAGGILPASAYGEAIEAYQSQLLATGFASLADDASFYTNHDMGRSAGYFAGDESPYRTRLAGALNLLMSGRVFVYYGEEIGMKGSGSDENFRAPMYWSSDASYEGLCTPPPGMDSFEMKFDSLEDQMNDPLSIYHYYREAVLLRARFPVISTGDCTFYDSLSSDSVCVIEKTDELGNTPVLIVINTSSEAQTVDVSALSYSQLSAVLAVSYEEATLSNGTLELPGYFIAVLT